MSRYVKNSELSAALRGQHEKYGAKGDDMAIESIEGLSTVAVIELFKDLVGSFNQSSCSCRFRIGDIYNMLGNGDPVLRSAALEKIRESFTEQERQNLRTCGWVAGKWKDRKLRDGHGWTYYLNNDPNKPLKEKEKRKQFGTAIGVDRVQGDWVVEFQDFSGKTYTGIVTNQFKHDHGMYDDLEISKIEEPDQVDDFADRELERELSAA